MEIFYEYSNQGVSMSENQNHHDEDSNHGVSLSEIQNEHDEDSNQGVSMSENQNDHEEINRNIQTVKEIKNVNIAIVNDKVETDSYIENFGLSFAECEKNELEEIERFSKLKLENRDLKENLEQIRNRRKVELEIDLMKRNVEDYADQVHLLKNGLETINLHKIKTVEWLKNFDQLFHYQKEEKQELCAYTEQNNQIQIMIAANDEYHAKIMLELNEFSNEHKKCVSNLGVSEHELIEEIEKIDINSLKTKSQEELSQETELTKELNKLQELFAASSTDHETIKANHQMEILNLENIISAKQESLKISKYNLEDLHKENEKLIKQISEKFSDHQILEDKLVEQEELITNLNQVKLEHELKVMNYKIEFNKLSEDFNAKLTNLNSNFNKTEQYNKKLTKGQVQLEEQISVLTQDENEISKEIEILQNKIELMKSNDKTEVRKSQSLIEEYNDNINKLRKNNDEQEKCVEIVARESEETQYTISDLLSKIERQSSEIENILEKKNTVADTIKEEIESLSINIRKIDTQCQDVKIQSENKKKELQLEAKEKINRSTEAAKKYKDEINIVLEKNEEKYINQISKYENLQQKLKLQISELQTTTDNLRKETFQVKQEISEISKLILNHSNDRKVQENQPSKEIPESTKMILRQSNTKKNKNTQPPKEKEPDSVKKIPISSSQITVNTIKSDKTGADFSVPQKPIESSTKRRVLSLWDTEESSEGDFSFTPKQAKTTTISQKNSKRCTNTKSLWSSGNK